MIASASGSIVQSNHYYPFGMSFAEGSTTSQQPYKYNGKDWYQDEKGNVLWQEGNGNIEGYKNIGASYTMDIGDVISITYTQIDATLMTFTGAKESSWESQITNGTNYYQASSEMLENEGVETTVRGTEVLVTGTAANGRAGDANANASIGFAVIGQALENGNPIMGHLLIIN